MNENEAQTKNEKSFPSFSCEKTWQQLRRKWATKQRIALVATVQKIDSKTDCQQAVNRHIEFDCY